MSRLVRNLLLILALLLDTSGATSAQDGEPTEEQLRRAVELRSSALVDLEEGRFESAAGQLEELASILPRNVLPAVDLAIAYFALGRVDEALRQADRALALDPNNSQALFAVAWSLRFEPAADERWHAIASRFAAAHPDDARPHYLEALHLRALHSSDEGVEQARLDALLRAHDRDADNLMLCLTLLESALAAGDEAAASDALAAAENRLGGFGIVSEQVSEQAAEHALELRQLLAEGAFGFDFGVEADATGENLLKARPRAAVLHNLLRAHDLYRLGSQRLSGGVGGETFAMQDFLPPLPKSVQGGADIEVAFVYLGSLPVGGSQLVSARRRGRDTLLLVGPRTRLEIDGLDTVRRVEPLDPGEDLSHEMPVAVGSWDVTGDGETDVLAADETGRFLEVIPSWLAGGDTSHELFDFGEPGQFDGLWPLDVDHDGDLDLFTGPRYLRNDGGTWTDQTGALGLVANRPGPVTDLVSADFDDDGDLDLVLLRGGEAMFLENRRAGALVDATEDLGLAQAGRHAQRIELADFDGDGRFDLLFWGRTGAELWQSGTSGFVRHAQDTDTAFESGWQTATAADFDNDGDVDLVVQRARGDLDLWLLRNRDGIFAAERIQALETIRRYRQLRAADLDGDGDLDLAALDDDGRLHRWRNDGGSENHWLRLTLVGREHNNSKNNPQGVFARVEARVGDRLLAVPSDGGVTHLGLGAARRAAVVRVVWPNGLSQYWQQVAADQSLVEEQVLKGSCPFLYAWDGDGFRFVTDLMWRSPLGMVMADGRAAPHQSARDAVLLPRGALEPVGDELWLSVTEELWEAAYVDEQVLYAVDHPADVELVVDERILPPPYPEALPLHLVDEVTMPSAATLHLEGHARDVLQQISARDETYVGDLALTRYQGLTEGQALELIFDQIPEQRSDGDGLRLLLWGWTFPTDTSINVALSADPELNPYGPKLEVWGDGAWRVVSGFVGFPAGKRKGMVVELPPDLSSRSTLRLRLSTNLQIYWDAAALAVSGPGEHVITSLRPRAANLHRRGVSKLVRRSPDGPHLFDYDIVRADSPFRPMEGSFTRFGDVSELLREADDRYVVMAAGDEMTVVYGAADLPPLPGGWVRRWVLFTDGWVKDADINTTASQSVEPLPYAAMNGYPDPEGHAYPETPEHREFLLRYQTRVEGDPP